MKVPRDLSGKQLARLLLAFGYSPTRQTGSHMTLTTSQLGEHHITVPIHKVLPIGTTLAILREVGRHFDLDREAVAKRLFERP
ncbi:MAG TPA: type II toxin-antitoxin system HicA family toxin [Bryobacterales bacterium]|nr:type II toxin-antitoxin system HicA family toxin [Bryobacterales bacterium]